MIDSIPPILLVFMNFLFPLLLQGAHFHDRPGIINQYFENCVRVIEEHLEGYGKVQLERDDVVALWVVRWAAMMCSRYLAGEDGPTARERRRGRRCRTPVVAFGEKVWHKQLHSGRDRKNKFESDWEEGLRTGHHRESNEAIVGAKEGVVRAYAIKRGADDERWDKALIKGIYEHTSATGPE